MSCACNPCLREMRDLLAAAKDLWLKLTSGRPETLPKLKQVLSQLRDKTTAIGEPSLSRLAAALAGRLDKLTTGTVSDALAMEYATGLLLADSALDNFASISPEFPKQVDAMLLRIDAAAQNLPVPDTAVAPILDEMARRAQERLVLAQVAREIQANLRHMEQVLDAFFRDHAKRADLATLTHDSAQITGALKMLGLERAEQLLALCQQQIDQYANPDTPVVDEDLESLAESLSGLGFYIEAVEQQRPDRERLIEPMLARRLGVEVLEPAPDVDTVETAVADMEAALPATLAAFQRAPGDAGARERLQADLTTLIDDAKLIDDAQLQEEASAALEELTRAREGDTAALQEAIGAIASSRAAAPAPAPSEETMRLLETDASMFDAELLEIYLTEADEVLDAIAASGAQLRSNRDDREALVTVRRGFHTLKGSGRMVGLSDLGDLAFDVEKVHNRLIEEDLPVTPATVELIDIAQTSFRGWLDALRRDGRVTADASALRAAVAKVVAEMPSPNEPLPPPPPTPPTGGPPPPPDSSAQAFTAVAPMIEVLELDETMPPDTDAASNDDAMTALDFPPVIEFTPRATTSHIEVARTIEVAAAAPPQPAPVESEETTVGDVTLSTALYRILCDEAQQHLATLDAELQTLQFDPAATPSQTMVRASHTLCGIHRTGGFPLLASTAKALEQCLLGLQARGAPLPGAALPVLARAIAGLTALAARVRRREAFDQGDDAEAAEIVAELETLRQEATTEPVLDDSESIAERVAEDEELAQAAAQPAAPIAAPKLVETVPPPQVATIAEPVAIVEAPAPPRVAPVIAPVPPPPIPAVATQSNESEALLAVSDDVDMQVLPIFLEEAAELFPQASEQLRLWRRKPGDVQPVLGLKRTLHTFKGSARMAGAMRLGEITHLMESRLPENAAVGRATPALLDALDNDLDHIAFVLDRLHKGEVNSPLPWLAVESAADAVEADSPAPAGADMKAPVVARCRWRRSQWLRLLRLPRPARPKARAPSCAYAPT